MNQNRKITLLVAEDDADDRLLMEKAFKRGMPNKELAYVEDGVQLMKYLKGEKPFDDREAFPKPDLILLDLNMPKMDGRSALKEIKSSADLCKIPVVIFTTSQSQDDINYTYRTGGNSYIMKPTSFEELTRLGKELDNYWFDTVELP